MEILSGSRCKDCSRHRGGRTDSVRARGKHGNVQLWGKCSNEPRVLHDPLVEVYGRFPALLESFGKLPGLLQGQQLLCSPKGYGGGAGTRAFQADLPEMQFTGTEIRVG